MWDHISATRRSVPLVHSGPDSVSVPGRPGARFSQKAQREPWTGQERPGGLRAKAGAGGGGSPCPAAFHGVTPPMGQTALPPGGGPTGPWAELGQEEHAVERKQRQAAERMGVPSGRDYQGHAPAQPGGRFTGQVQACGGKETTGDGGFLRGRLQARLLSRL